MKILILHRVPYDRIEYGRGIDHDVHEVTYFGVKTAIATLPPGLRYEAVERPGKEAVFDEARAWLDADPRSFDHVISLSEYELLDAAKLREHLGIPGATLADVQLVRDKVQMKEAVQRAGLRVPRFLSLQAFLEGPNASEWTGATVLKPHSGASSEDVVVFASTSEARSAIRAGSSGAKRLDDGTLGVDAYEVEEFVSGDVLHFDGLVENGVVLTMTASRYVGTCLGFAKGTPLGSFHFPLSPASHDWALKALSAVGIVNGSFHLEAIENADELVFLEVGNRVGGADVVATFELATGVHLPSEELRVLLGTGPSRVLPTTQTDGLWHGWFVFPGHAYGETEYQGVAGIESFRNDPAVNRWIELPVGQSLSTKVTYSANEVPVAGIVAHAAWQSTKSWIESLFAAADPSSVVTRQAA